MGQEGRVSCKNVPCDDLASGGSPSSGLCQRVALVPGAKAGYRATCSLSKGRFCFSLCQHRDEKLSSCLEGQARWQIRAL